MHQEENDKEFFFKDESFRIRSCVFEVNRKLGNGFLEAVYQGGTFAHYRSLG
jgi:hypothetical protein